MSVYFCLSVEFSINFGVRFFILMQGETDECFRYLVVLCMLVSPKRRRMKTRCQKRRRRRNNSLQLLFNVRFRLLNSPSSWSVSASGVQDVSNLINSCKFLTFWDLQVTNICDNGSDYYMKFLLSQVTNLFIVANEWCRLWFSFVFERASQ